MVVLLAIGKTSLLAQQTPLLSHYYYNPYLINPSLAGQSKDAQAFLLYRRQWTGVPDSPETQVLTIDGPLNDKKVGLGLNVTNDVTSIIHRLNIKLGGSYTVTFATENELSFGMSMGILRNQLRFDKIRADLSDPEILLNAESRTMLDGNAGVSYRFHQFRAGFVSEQLFNKAMVYQNDTDFKAISFALVRHYLLSLQYSFLFKNELELTPLVVVRTAEGLSPQLDINATVKYKNIVWGNVVYRHKAGTGVAAGTNVGERFTIGYAYEMPLTDIRYASGGSHEVMIGMRFLNRKEKYTSPKATSSKVMDEYKKDTYAQYEKLDAIQQQNEALNRQLEDYKKVIEQQNSEIEKLKKSISSVDNELKSTVDKLKVDLQKGDAFDKTSSYYLVIGAFKSLAEAKSFQKIVRRETNLKPEIIQSESQTWYFMYSDEVQSPVEAIKKMKDLEKSNVKPFIVGNPWVYKAVKRN